MSPRLAGRRSFMMANGACALCQAQPSLLRLFTVEEEGEIMGIKNIEML